MREQNFLGYIRDQLKRSGLLGKILLINTVVFLFLLTIQIVAFLYVKEKLPANVTSYLAAPSDPAMLIFTPWSPITSLFTHFDFGHYLFNMMVLFFTGVIFQQFFSDRRLLLTYILGGLFAYVVHVASFYVFPVYASKASGYVLGASGAIMAIFMAIAFHRPSLKVNLFGIIPVPIIAIAILYILTDLSGITESTKDGGPQIAHFAHLGGAIFGVLSIVRVNSSKQFMNRLERFFSKIKWPKFSFKRKPKMKVYQGGAQTKNMTDEEFNYNKKMRQEKLDAILDKIGKKGYEGLTKEEKDFLFNESQRK